MPLSVAHKVPPSQSDDKQSGHSLILNIKYYICIKLQTLIYA